MKYARNVKERSVVGHTVITNFAYVTSLEYSREKGCLSAKNALQPHAFYQVKYQKEQSRMHFL